MEDEVYQKMYENEDTFWWNIGIRKVAAALLNKYISRKSENKILDVGCGTGSMFSLLRNYGSVWGIDASSTAVSYARRRGIANAVSQAFAEKMPFPNNYFDIVVCFDVLYHQWIGDEGAVVREMKRVLKPGGILILKEPAYDWLRSQHDKIFWTKRRFSKKKLVRVLRNAGFVILKSSYVSFLLFPLAFVKRFSERIWPEKHPFENLFASSKLMDNLKFCLYAESAVIKYVNFPFGLSVMCVAKK